MKLVILKAENHQKTIAVDFDGVIHSYQSGWQGEAVIPDPPVPGATEAVREMQSRGWKVVVYSTRGKTASGRKAMQNYLSKNGIDAEIAKDKPAADVYIDDRALRFKGKWAGIIDKVENFKSWVEDHKKLKKSMTWSGHKLHYRTDFQGLPISIENRKGSVRRGTDEDGTEWENKMDYPYGYIRLTEGVDGDHLDCFIGPDKESKRVYIIHQVNPETKKFDEDKIMLAFDNAEAAKTAYLKQYDNPGFFGTMEITDIDKFKELIEKRKGKKLIVPVVKKALLVLLKAKKKGSKLVPKKVWILPSIGKKGHYRTVWVDPTEEEGKQVGQFELFEEESIPQAKKKPEVKLGIKKEKRPDLTLTGEPASKTKYYEDVGEKNRRRQERYMG